MHSLTFPSFITKSEFSIIYQKIFIPKSKLVVFQDEDASFRQRVEALLLCAVCHETVTDPRELNCGHFFCSECVDLLNGR